MPLSFFTNSGNSYGSAIPFQRIVEPAQLGFFLNLEQAELLRIQRYNEHWRFYFGRHWLFKREDGEPLVTMNYFRKFIDKIVYFLVGKGFSITTPEALEEITKPFLDEVWGYNSRERFAFEGVTMGSVTGDMFAMITYEDPSPMQRRLNPFSQGRIRINLLGSEQVYPTWDPLNQDTLIAVRIETIYYAERGTRQLDREDRVNHEGRQLYTKRFTQIITPDSIVEQFHGDQPIVRPNVLGEIPLVHIKNLPLPKEYYGLADGQDLVDLQRELNEKATDVSDTINYHASPVLLLYGVKAKQLERGPKQVWSGLPTDSRVDTLKLEGDLTAANGYIDRVKKTMHDIGDVPEGSLGQMQPISNTSGVALHFQNLPLIERRTRKLAMYKPGFEQINYFILRIGMIKGLINLPFDICKSCGGRIVQTDRGKRARVWDPELEVFVEQPVLEKRCYHIDRQTLDFLDPFDMRLKVWRKYGFGKELRDLPYSQIMREIQAGGDGTSFWDYTAVQKRLLEEWERKHVKQGQEQEKAPPEPPPNLHVEEVPMDQIEVPEEPEHVHVTQHLVHPSTGEVLGSQTTPMFLIPTGCKKPVYLNPFDNEVDFLDVIPKDQALQAQLFEMYQRNEWVDAEWCQDHISEIAVDATAIRKRLKSNKSATANPAKPAPPMEAEGANQRVYQELAPPPQPASAVPGNKGNPVPADQQLEE